MKQNSTDPGPQKALNKFDPPPSGLNFITDFNHKWPPNMQVGSGEPLQKQCFRKILNRTQFHLYLFNFLLLQLQLFVLSASRTAIVNKE